MDALEVLDPVRNAGAGQRRQQVERSADGRIADGVDGGGDARLGGRAYGIARPRLAVVIGMPRSRLPS